MRKNDNIDEGSVSQTTYYRLGSRKGMQFMAEGHTLDEHNDDIAELFGMNDEYGEINIGVSSERIHPKRKLGIMGGNFAMAEDFDETPDCFKTYI